MATRKVLLGNVGPIAADNAFKVNAFESNLGIIWEPAWQAWTIDIARWLLTLMNWADFMTFFPIIAATAIIYYLEDHRRYGYYRYVWLLSFVVALLVFIFFPLRHRG